MLSSSSTKSYAISNAVDTGASITTNLSTTLQLGGGSYSACLSVDVKELLYVIPTNGSTTGFSTINPFTGVRTSYTAGNRVLNSIAVTFSGVVFMSTGGNTVYAAGGSYGSFADPTLLFTVSNGILDSIGVDDAGQNVYLIETTGTNLCKFNAWSGGTATRTVLESAPYLKRVGVDNSTGDIYLNDVGNYVARYVNNGGTMNLAYSKYPFNAANAPKFNIDNTVVIYDSSVGRIKTPNPAGDITVATLTVNDYSTATGTDIIPSRTTRSYYSVSFNNPNTVTVFPSSY